VAAEPIPAGYEWGGATVPCRHVAGALRQACAQPPRLLSPNRQVWFDGRRGIWRRAVDCRSSHDTVAQEPHDRRDPGSMGEASDEELMVRIAAGNEPAFRELARRHTPLALGLARRVTANAAEAEEVVQEALLRVWINAPRWRPVASFRTWFYRIVLNLCLNRRRRAPFLPIETAGEPAASELDAEASLE